MLNKIIHASLQNRVVTLVLGAMILLAGCVALLRMEIDIFPDLNAPTVVVMTEAPGLAPEEVEQLVTYPVETAVNGASGVRRVRSSSATGFSVVWVEFDWQTDVYRARQIVAEKLSAVGSSLPREAGVPVLGPQSSILGEMMIIGLQADSTSLRRLRTLADRTIAPRLLALGGVSQVSVIGGDVEEFQIQLMPERMRHYGITLDQAMEAASGLTANAAGGILYQYGNEYIIKGHVNTSDTALLGQGVVASDGDRTITLADIANVTVGGKTPRLGTASVNASPAVLITVTKQPSAGTIELTGRIDRELASLAPSLPSDIRMTTDIFRQSEFIESSISNLQQSLFEGALFVIVILFVFLMNIRTTVISIVALPLSVIVTILVLNALGMTINTMSLGGIAIAIGSLVDDAIVDVENVYKRLRHNAALPQSERKSKFTVVFEASKEVRMPIFNSSLIIMASFLPLFFLSGIEGRMLVPLGISFIVALIASTLVALTITPVLCYYLLGAHTDTSREPWASRRLRAAYTSALQRAMRHKKGVIGSAAALFVIAMGVSFTLGRSFLPPFNEGSFTINVSTLPGISLDESDRVGRIAEETILSMPEISTVARKTGRAELDEHSLGVNVSEIEAPYKLSGRSRQELARDLREKLSAIPGANIEVGQPISHRIDAMLSGTQAQIAVKIFGPDLERLHSIGTDIRRTMHTVEGVTDVNIEQQVGRPQLDIRPRREMLAKYGIPLGKFVEFVDVALAGRVVSTVYSDGLPYDVTLRLADDYRDSMEGIASALIDSNSGKIPLNYVAEIVSTSGPNTINRENVCRRLVVSANVDNRDLRSTVEDIRHAIDDTVTLPEGYYVTYGGQFESEEAASRTLMLATCGALLIILLLLYMEYRQWRQPLIILINMPLAMIGGIFMLRVTSGELNIPAIIGFISLLGITTRNGMLLISRFNRLEAEGVALHERIIRGASDRLLPIVMTALTSALALVPLALRGNAPGNEIQSPMAIVILGGLITSTVLNIFVVPALYALACRKTSRQ